AIAALIVITSHVDEFSYLFNKHESGFRAKDMAQYAVTLFFVLSGFLITYLLILEKNRFNTIEFKKFYMRRILRIWPVYFLIVLIVGCLVSIGGILPEDRSNLPHILYYIFFIPNVPFALGGTFAALTPLWSVGVEEQFYAFWPLLMNKAKNIPKALLLFIGIYLLLKVALQYSPFSSVYHVFYITRLDCMAIGGLGAYLVLSNHRLLNIIYSKLMQIVCWALFIGSVSIRSFHVFSILDHEIYSLIFLVLIMNVSTNQHTIIKLENKSLRFIGKISYGMYAYHMLFIFLLSKFISGWLESIPNAAAMLIVYVLTLCLTITFSYLSYQFLEKRFLKMKKRYTDIKSSNQPAKPSSKQKELSRLMR
ncbi:MAG: acyltransferase, partial [Bacteroidetes bacterium]|nr:acyltransferase [Bacteroidota bacterium]